MNRSLIVRSALAASAVLAITAAQASVSTQLFDYGTPNGDGTPFGAPVGAPIITDQVSFLTDNGWYWFPLGGVNFGAQTTGFIRADVTGEYTFGLNSDDGSSFTMNGETLENLGEHGVSAQYKTYHLEANVLNPFVINFYENGWGESGYDLLLKNDDGCDYLVPKEMFQSVPEPASMTVLGLGALALLRKRAKGSSDQQQAPRGFGRGALSYLERKNGTDTNQGAPIRAQHKPATQLRSITSVGSRTRVQQQPVEQ